MARPSNRERILTEGLRVVHARGFGGASVRDIVQAAGVPQGSFTNHFASKEAFGLEILERHFAAAQALMAETLLNDSRPPLERLVAYIDANLRWLDGNEMRNGCLFGNFSAEASEHSPAIRARIVEIFAEVQSALAYCLRAAAASGEVPADLDCDDIAGFVLASMQGAILLGKAQQSTASVERFKRILLTRVLR